MSTSNATILIPDISGFTEFMTTTELTHGSQAINMLIDAIVAPIDDEYEVAEIEGDAVLMIRKGNAPSKKQITDTCLKIFNSFHAQRRWIQKHSVCPCGACLCIGNLTVKFIVHHGPVAEIKVGRFVKQSGTELIIAHRLLKNNIDNHEYLLITDKLLRQVPDANDSLGMQWNLSSEQYNSIGKVDFQFAELNALKSAPSQADLENYYQKDNTPYNDMRIAASFRDVYMVMMNIPGRAEWYPDVIKVEQSMPGVFVGSIHQVSCKNFEVNVSPLNMTLSDEGILYAESHHTTDHDTHFIHEFFFKKIDGESCNFMYRSMTIADVAVPNAIIADRSAHLERTAAALKDYCEARKVSFFKPAFQKN